MERYYSLNRYLRTRFGEKVYKLALEGGTTCPNRDGTAGIGGCIFCGEGSGTFTSDSIDTAIEKLSSKAKGNKFIAYFQSYTSTYKLSENVVHRMFEAANDSRIVCISIATRPDCLPDHVMELLQKLNEIKPVWVELGLQSANEATAQRINRGYPLRVFEEAVLKLRSISIDVIVHLILGLPGENKEDILNSIHFLNRQDIQGVKLQLLHLLKNTKLGRMYKLKMDDQGNFHEYPYSLEEYADLICECISNLRKDIVVHRITGDAPKKDLIAPLWSGDKKRVLNTIHRRMEEKNTIQGELWNAIQL